MLVNISGSPKKKSGAHIACSGNAQKLAPFSFHEGKNHMSSKCICGLGEILEELNFKNAVVAVDGHWVKLLSTNNAVACVPYCNLAITFHDR